MTSGLWCSADPERPTMWNMLMTCGYLTPLFFNLLDNEFTFKNLEIKFYKTGIQWWWISKQRVAQYKLWIDIQVAEDVNRWLARILIREDESINDCPLLGNSDSVEGQKFHDQKRRNQRKTETSLGPESRKAQTAIRRSNSQVTSFRGLSLSSDSWFDIKLFS